MIINGSLRNIILLGLLITSQSLFANRICDDYITDEWPNSRYFVEAITGDTVVTDKITGLMWKQCSEGLLGPTCLGVEYSQFNWKTALLVPQIVNNAGYAGYSDWRLPNIEELRSLVAYNCVGPAINETVFPNTPVNWFWSSSPSSRYTGNSWGLFFGEGQDNEKNLNSNIPIRLVRGP